MQTELKEIITYKMQTKLKEITTYLQHVEVSDSFVYPFMKLSGGKDGNGESRLFISNSKDICTLIAKEKKIKICFSNDYIEELESFVSQSENFKKKNKNRLSIWKDNISNMHDETINIETQNGTTDVNRNYVGQTPHRRKKNISQKEKSNIKKWDMFRKCLVPTKTTLVFLLCEDGLILNVLYNHGVHKYNKPAGCSFVSIEFFNQFEKVNNIEIQHAMNGTEHKERKENGYFWPVDGYHNCKKHRCCGTEDKPCVWNNYVFEFQGTYWHKDKKEKDLAKKEFYTEKGYNWYEITEREFTDRKKLIKQINQHSQSS